MGMLDKMRKDADAGHAHDHHHDAHAKQGPPGTVRDPVCGMWVDPKKAPAKSEYGGQTVYFCSPGCKTKFDATPDAYAAKLRRA